MTPPQTFNHFLLPEGLPEGHTTFIFRTPLFKDELLKYLQDKSTKRYAIAEAIADAIGPPENTKATIVYRSERKCLRNCRGIGYKRPEFDFIICDKCYATWWHITRESLSYKRKRSIGLTNYNPDDYKMPEPYVPFSYDTINYHYPPDMPKGWLNGK